MHNVVNAHHRVCVMFSRVACVSVELILVLAFHH